MPQEEQITQGHYGHMLNSNQVFSPDDVWVAYDTRNDQTHIGRTCCIEKVNVSTGDVVRLYKAPNQTLYGPGVGAVAYHPTRDKMIFIHGLLNCDQSRPYGFTRRFGAILEESIPLQVSPAESRIIEAPFQPGALRGGTHAHSWSADGEWISFTYNDFVMEQLAQSSENVKDLRTIGVMSTGPDVNIREENAENFRGNYFAAVAATVTESPRPGSDEIERAFDECWIGSSGYLRSDGRRQVRAIAFQGDLRKKDGSLLTEVFVSDVPVDIAKPSANGKLQGTPTSRPSVPEGLVQRRITFTEDRKYPGIQGPRCWLRSAPDGTSIYFLSKDDRGIVQVFSVSVTGSDIRQITDLPASVQAQFNISPDGRTIALIADNSVWLAAVASGRLDRLSKRFDDTEAPELAVNWNRAGNMLIYNRYVSEGPDRFLQIFKISLV